MKLLELLSNEKEMLKLKGTSVELTVVPDIGLGDKEIINDFEEYIKIHPEYKEYTLHDIYPTVRNTYAIVIGNPFKWRKAKARVTYHMVSETKKHNVNLNTHLLSLDAEELYEEIFDTLDMFINIDRIELTLLDTNEHLVYEYQDKEV